MQALILAAGGGIRLHPFTYKRPKCLIKINSHSIIELMLNELAACGINEVFIVVGYKKEMITNKLGNKYRNIKIKYIFNEEHASTNNMYSLWKAREHIFEDLLLIHGDVICDPLIVKKVLAATASNLFAVDVRDNYIDEDYKTKIINNRIIDMGKQIPLVPGAKYGEAIGINKFDQQGKTVLFNTMDKFVKSGRTNIFWEDALKTSLDKIDINVLDISGLRWVEVDFRSDLKKARQLFQT